MSMDTIVALIRNGLCCVKDLGLFSSSALYNPAYVALIYTLPPPLNETTPLELMVGLCQIYAVISMTLGGMRGMKSGMSALRKSSRVRRAHKSVEAKGEQASNRVVEQSLNECSADAVRSIIVGVCLFSTGLCFIWLSANSFHITQAGWIGGVAGLIQSLAVAELMLLFFLYYMLKDGFRKLRDARAISLLKGKLVASKGRLATITTKDYVADAHVYGWVVHDGWKPFWNDTGSTNTGGKDEESMLRMETQKVRATIDALFAEEKKGSKSENDDESRALSVAVQVASSRLDREARVSWWKGALELVFFLLNFIAFYGYGLCVLCYYIPSTDKEPMYWNRMKLGLSNEEADWFGNFSGDLCWTIEPFISIVASYAVSRLASKQKAKVKSE